jgi:hypothetical protein
LTSPRSLLGGFEKIFDKTLKMTKRFLTSSKIFDIARFVRQFKKIFDESLSTDVKNLSRHVKNPPKHVKKINRFQFCSKDYSAKGCSFRVPNHERCFGVTKDSTS